MRNLFTDGLNSFWHFLFGFLSFYYKLIFPVFIVYELSNYKDPNLLIDFSELPDEYVKDVNTMYNKLFRS